MSGHVPQQPQQQHFQQPNHNMRMQLMNQNSQQGMMQQQQHGYGAQQMGPPPGNPHMQMMNQGGVNMVRSPGGPGVISNSQNHRLASMHHHQVKNNLRVLRF